MAAPPPRSHLHSLRTTSFASKSLAVDWGGDDGDAWDSASDDDVPNIRSLSLSFASPSGSLRAKTPSTATSKSSIATPRPAPIPITTPRTARGSPSHPASPPHTTHNGSGASSNSIDRSSASIGGLSSSYTYVQAPSPSSYPQPNALPSHAEDDGDWQEQDIDERTRQGWEMVGADPSIEPSGSILDLDNERESSQEPPGPDQLVLGDFEQDYDPPPKVGKEAILADVDDIVKDPLYPLKTQRVHSPGTPSRRDTDGNTMKSRASTPGPPFHQRKGTSLTRGRSLRTTRRYDKIIDCLTRPDVNIVDLRKLAWSGLPDELRPVTWPLLLGYLPLPASSRLQVLARKREEYVSLVQLTFARGKEGLDQQIWHQIEIDVPRTRPGVQLWMYSATQRSLERILYVWAIRHPASGYVQGINDLVTPFYQVFLSAYIDAEVETFDPAHLPEHAINAIEADSFWCLSRLLDGIQDNYISQQPGIQRSVRRMQDLVGRIDAPLAAHLESEGVEFMQFAFRWMNCLLMREISVKNTIRMWDTYLAEGTEAFSQFHLYVCSAFLVKWSATLREMDFQGVIMFLQSLPTGNWTEHDVELLLSEAFLLSSVWHNAQSHFGGGSSIGLIGR